MFLIIPVVVITVISHTTALIELKFWTRCIPLCHDLHTNTLLSNYDNGNTTVESREVDRYIREVEKVSNRHI